MILDFGKYSLEILFSYLSTFSLILILVISTYLNSKKVKKDLNKLKNKDPNDSKKVNLFRIIPLIIFFINTISFL